MLIPVLGFGQGTGTGLKGDYFKNTSLSGTVALTRTDGQVNFIWAQGAPANGFAGDKFSVRWTGQVEAPVTGAFEFLTRSDDGVRLWVNGKLLVNHWSSHGATWDQSVPLNLTAGQKYNIQLEYFENTGNSTIQLFWRYPGQAEVLIPKARLYPTAITPLPAPPVVSRRWLSDLNYLSTVNGWGPMEEDRSNGEQGPRDGKTLTIAGRRYGKGLGVHARSEVVYALNDQYDMFKAVIGVDDEVRELGSVVFEVFGDGKSLFKSGVMRGNMPGLAIEVPVENVRQLRLVVTDAGDGIGHDHADWADARFEGIERIRYLSDMRWDAATNGNGPVEKDKANGGTAANDGKRIMLRGQEYRKGLGTHAAAEIKYDLDKKFELFSAVLGIDDAANGQGSVIYEVWVDGKQAYRSGMLRGSSPVQHIALPVLNAELLVLKVLDGGDGKTGDLADWADAKLLPINSDVPPPPPPPVGAPAAPTNLTAAPGVQQVALKWNTVSNATSYHVYAGTSANGQSNTPVASNLTKNEFIHAGLTAGVKMYYKVRAVNSAGTGNPSNEANATPTAPPVPVLPPPTTITLTASNTQIVLNWGAVNGAVSYNLYRSTTSNGQGNTPVATNIRATTFTDKPLNNGTRYFYKLATVNATGVGAQSAEVNAVPLAPPVAPTGLTATPGNTQITLAWTPVTGATGYNLYRGTVANQQAATPIATNLSTPTFVNTGLTNGTTYFYKVTALNPSGESPRSSEASAQPVAPQQPVDPATLSAFRATRQITWGPRPGDVDRVKTIGRNAFLDEQFAQPMTTFPDSLYNESTEVFQEYLVRQFISAPDQLRLRVAWALSQIWVVSGVEIPRSDAMINYYRVLMNHSFGNYRDLMRDMTLNPAMGRYLNMLNNRSQQVTGQPPNENYAREICQLFTKGLVALNPDGSSNGQPGFTEADVANLARIFTGWTFGDGNANNAQPNNLTPENWRVPMEAVERFHDTQAKTFLGQNFVPGRTARQDLDQALDAIFNDASVPPFVSRQLIQRLVTSNPSPAYISAVAGVFANNGAGVRGDLRAVIRAILTHPEASLGTNTAGKLMEPILFTVSQLRGLNATVADHPFITDYSTEMGQRVLYSPSVFNYYSPGFRIRGTTLFGPEFQIHTSVTSLTRANFVGKLISGGFGGDVTINYQPFTSRAGNPGDLVDYIGLLFMGGNMSSAMRNEIVRAVSVTPASNTTERVRTALFLALTAAQYQVER